jgi:photosystem II stability/assembly factor-like uncharacterized protein
MRIRTVIPILFLLALAGCGGSSSPSSGSASTPPPSSNANLTSSQNHLHSIVILPNNPNTLYIGAHFRLYKSTDGGKKWRSLTKQMMLSMAMDPAHPSRLWAVSLQRGLVMSPDAGTHWFPSQGTIPRGYITGVIFDPATRAVFAYGQGAYRSKDAGADWTRVLSGQISSMAAGANQTVYAASGNGLYVSHAGGTGWKLVHSIGNQPVVQVAASGHVAYAVAAIGLFRSTNDGLSWKLLDRAPQGLQFIGVAPSSPNEVIANVAGKGFYASHDGGLSWQPANQGIHDTKFTSSTVRIAASSPSIAYTGAWGLHFYASHDGGRHWTETSTLIH